MATQVRYLGESAVLSKRAIELNRDHPAPHHNLGLALLLLGQIDDGVAELREGLRLDSQSVEYRIDLASAYHRIYDRLAVELKALPSERQGGADPRKPIGRRAEVNEKLHAFDYRAESLALYREAARRIPPGKEHGTRGNGLPEWGALRMQSRR
jgi:tetratricopeptide (TPR) repeat protein